MRKPTHLHRRAYHKYEELEKILGDKLKPGDENLLAVLANAYVNYWDYQSELMERPATQGGKERTYKNPLHDMIKDREQKILEMTKHFGFSPWTRGEDLAKVEEKEDELDKLLKG